MSTHQPNQVPADKPFTLSPGVSAYLTEFSDGYRLGALWLATCPPAAEVERVALIADSLRNGGSTGTDTYIFDADLYGSMTEYLTGHPHQIEIFDGVQYIADVNERQGTAFSCPKRAFRISFDSFFLLGFADAAHLAVLNAA